MIGTTAALVLGGATIGKALLDHHAATTAVKEQQKGTDDAKAKAAEIWGIQQANAKPYIDAGANSVSLLGRLMTPGVAYNDTRYGGPPAGMMAPRASAGGGAPMGPGPGQSPVPSPSMPTPQPQPQPQPQSGNMSGGMGATMMGPGTMIKLQSPDGTTRSVPAQFAAELIKRGARRVG